MEGRQGQQPPQTKISVHLIICLTFVMISACRGLGSPEPLNLHQTYRWELVRWEDWTKVGEFVGSLESDTPHFVTTLCKLVPREPCLNSIGFYMCPAEGPSDCNYTNHYYCAYWGCETVASSWKLDPQAKDKDVKVDWWPPNCRPYRGIVAEAGGSFCEQININITDPKDPKWTVGKVWGLRYYEEGPDQGGLFTIQRFPVLATPTSALGLNQTIAPGLDFNTLSNSSRPDGVTDMTPISKPMPSGNAPQNFL